MHFFFPDQKMCLGAQMKMSSNHQDLKVIGHHHLSTQTHLMVREEKMHLLLAGGGTMP